MSVMIRVLSNVQHQVYNSSGGNHYFFFIKKPCHNVYITMTFPLRAEVKKNEAIEPLQIIMKNITLRVIYIEIIPYFTQL